MRTYMVEKREGELLGPVEWEYDFMSHFDGYGGPPEQRQKYCDEQIAKLRNLADGGEWMATTDGGWPRCGWGKVVAVGMYDGWPYWRPVPSVAIAGTLGTEWHSFSSVTDIQSASVPNI